MIPIPDPTADFCHCPWPRRSRNLRLVNHNQRERASEGLLDVVASALSVVGCPCTAASRAGGSAMSSWAAAGFCNGATHLRFRDGTPPIENLAILQSDLEATIRRLERAGVCFSDAIIEQAPRRLPRVLPAYPVGPQGHIANAFTDAQAFTSGFGRRSLSSTGTRSIHWRLYELFTRRQSRGITGGTTGIGLAIAKEFVAEGATVVVTGLEQEPLDRAVEEIGPRSFGRQGGCIQPHRDGRAA